MTTCRPPKFARLISVIIATIRRAVRFFGLRSAAYAAQPVSLPVWQSSQEMPSAAEKTPIVPISSLTVVPFNTWMFLNTSSAISGF